MVSSVHFTPVNLINFLCPENCCTPANDSGYMLVSNIRQAVAMLGGGIIAFNAYADVSIEIEARKRQREEMQASGVCVVDCPHNGQKEVADKVLIGELLCKLVLLSS